MRKTLVAITLSILLVAALGMTALGATPIKGGTLRVAVTSIQQLGLYKSASNDENDATSLIFDQLFVISKNDFQPIPHLAESWDNPDPLTWVFHIRKGTMFHDDNAVFPKGKSREVVADDVVYSINRMIKLSTSFVLGPIKSVKALDRYTVEIKTETPQPFLVNDSNRLARMSVVPKEAIDKLGEDGFAKMPIGSGPFKFKNFSPDSGLVIVRNDLYWLPIYLDAVEFVTIPDPAVQTLALQSGEVHVVKHLFNLEVAQTFEKNKNFQLLSRGGSYRGLGFNVSVAPYDNFEVRDAISKILDIDAAFKAVIGSHGERAYGQCPPWVPHGYDPSLKSIWSYDPAAGLKLLEKNGFKDVNNDGFLEWNGKPFKVEIKTLAGSQVKVLTIFATQLREKGVNASVLQQDTAVWADDLVQGKTGLFFDYSFAGTTGFHSLFHSSMIGKSNTHYYKNAEVDKLLDEALTKTKFSELSALWKKAQKIVFEQRVGIPMYFEWSYTIASTKVNDLVPPWGGFNLVTIENNVWLSK